MVLVLDQTVHGHEAPANALAKSPLPKVGLANALGIKRVVIRRRYHTGYANATMVIALSAGDGIVRDWTCDLPPLPPASACRSPDGCLKQHVDGTYCIAHRLRYLAPLPLPGLRRPSGRKTAPRLDLLR